MGPTALVLWIATQTASVAPCLAPEGSSAELGAQVLSALALSEVEAGRLPMAAACLEEAWRLAPSLGSLRRDLAEVYAAQGRVEEALTLLQDANSDPETKVLRAILEARRGQGSLAIQLADEADNWEGRLVGSALGDPVAAQRTIELIEEESSRGAAASVLLAAREGARGELAAASRLAALAEGQAKAAGSAPWLEAARALGRRVDDRAESPVGSLRLRSALDYTTNPRFVTGRAESRTPGLRLALTAEGGGEISVGRWTASGAARIDHHTFLSERETLRSLDLFAYSVSAGIHYALSRNPSSAVLGLVARFSDVFGDYFSTHYATTIEGGPNLTLQVTARLGLQLGLYGAATDFIDVSPPDGLISSLNRDRVGQRAVLALSYDVGWAYGRAEGMFLHDSSLGDAFDTIGAATAIRVGVEPVAGVLLEGGVALTLRDFGPVGDEAIIGPAATRSELRVVAEMGVRVALAPHVDLLIEYMRIASEARVEHSYTESLLSMGAEARW